MFFRKIKTFAIYQLGNRFSHSEHCFKLIFRTKFQNIGYERLTTIKNRQILFLNRENSNNFSAQNINRFTCFHCYHIGLYLGNILNYKTIYSPNISKMLGPSSLFISHPEQFCSNKRIVFNPITLSSNFSMIFCSFVIRLTGIYL